MQWFGFEFLSRFRFCSIILEYRRRFKCSERLEPWFVCCRFLKWYNFTFAFVEPLTLKFCRINIYWWPFAVVFDSFCITLDCSEQNLHKHGSARQYNLRQPNVLRQNFDFEKRNTLNISQHVKPFTLSAFNLEISHRTCRTTQKQLDWCRLIWVTLSTTTNLLNYFGYVSKWRCWTFWTSFCIFI